MRGRGVCAHGCVSGCGVCAHGRVRVWCLCAWACARVVLAAWQCARVRVPLSIAPCNLYLFNLVINIWKCFMFFNQVLTLTSTLFTPVK